MKRVPVLLAVLLLAFSLSWAQNKNTQNKNAKSAKPKAPAVDCSKTDDAKITEDVKAKFAATASLKDQAINVATSGGEVTLTGSVKKGNQKGLATMQAKRVACVKKVDNKITVETSTSTSTKNSNSKKRSSNKNM